MLLLETNTQSTHITICNYESYQDKQTANKPQTNHEQTANKLRTNTNNKENNVNNVNNIITNKEYLDKYGLKLLQAFVDYWCEKSVNGKKMRWQKEKAFDIDLRLIKWSKNDFDGYYKRHKEERINKEQDEYYKEAEKNAYKTPEYQNKEIKNMISGIGKKV